MYPTFSDGTGRLLMRSSNSHKKFVGWTWVIAWYTTLTSRRRQRSKFILYTIHSDSMYASAIFYERVSLTKSIIYCIDPSCASMHKSDASVYMQESICSKSVCFELSVIAEA